MNPLISIIIPTFNRENLIVDALETCLNQTYRPLEVIVIDDGSSDNTKSVVNTWFIQNNTPRFSGKLISQSNKGGNAARNRGIKASSGEFIAFLDSDDTWDPLKISKQYEILIDNKTIGGVYCGLREIEIKSGKILNDKKRSFKEGFILSDLLIKDVTAPTSTYLIRKKVFDEVGQFDEKLQARQDWDMWIRLSTKYEIRAVKENLIDLRHHEGPRTASNPFKEINAYQSIRAKYKYLLEQQSMSIQKEAKANYYKRLGRVHFHHNISTTKALGFYLKALSIYPKDFDNWAALIGLFVPRVLREKMNIIWNKIFYQTRFAIRSH